MSAVVPFPTVTTNDTLSADLKATLIKMDLEEHDVCYHTEAEHTARLVVALHDPAARDAAIWRGAEALYGWMHPDASADEPLRTRPLHERTFYTALAMQCWAWMRLTLEGTFTPTEVAQAYADYANHQSELATRRYLRAVECDVNGNQIEE